MKRISPTLKALHDLRVKFAPIAAEHDIDLGATPNDLPLEKLPRYKTQYGDDA